MTARDPRGDASGGGRFELDPPLNQVGWSPEFGSRSLEFRAEPVARNELARGGALHAPTEIPTEAVLEHALRHLRWLIGDDEGVRDAVPDCPPALEAYVPEPFRAFGARVP